MRRVLSAIAALCFAVSVAYATNTFLRDDGTFAFPAGVGTVNGPGSSTVNDFALWNNTSGTLLLDATPTTATSLLNVFTSSLKGLTPSSGGGTTNFLRADATWAAPPTPGLTYINTVSVSGGAISDTSDFGGSFRSFKLVFRNVVTSANTTVSLQVHSGGSFQATSYLGSMMANANGGAPAGATITTGVLLYTSSTGTADPGFSGEVTVSGLSSTTIKKILFGQTSGLSSAGTVDNNLISGYWDGGNGAIDGFQLVPGTGTFTAGNVDIYGLL